MKLYEVVMREEEMPRVSDIRPGEQATIDMGGGIKTVVDLKKNPAALIKDPTGKVMMTKAASGATGGSIGGAPQKPEELIKPGEPVFVADKTMEGDSESKTPVSSAHRARIKRMIQDIARSTASPEHKRIAIDVLLQQLRKK